MRWPGRVPCGSPLPPWQRLITVGEKRGGPGGLALCCRAPPSGSSRDPALYTHTRTHTHPAALSRASPGASPRLPPPLPVRPISVTASHPAGLAAAAAAFLLLPGPRRPFPSCSG